MTEVENPRLEIRNLSYFVTDEEFLELFSKFGKVHKAEIYKNSDGLSRGFGFIDYKDRKEATDAFNAMHRTKIKNAVISILLKLPKIVAKVEKPSTTPSTSTQRHSLVHSQSRDAYLDKHAASIKSRDLKDDRRRAHDRDSDRSGRDDRNDRRDERSRDDRPSRDDRGRDSRDDRRDERGRDNRDSRDDRRDERNRDERNRDERSRDERSRDERRVGRDREREWHRDPRDHSPSPARYDDIRRSRDGSPTRWNYREPEMRRIHDDDRRRRMRDDEYDHRRKY
ncbi:hypothetical protein TRFO_31398 [Tritrichomonas foetus]|uniref:RRM domain-containing protein n=1 Tax=Tritrichomonas foetus TaxID=1144522 RepID=A0A1J4JW02_9EUKA|nr:hypothetical protein TRFO_31398 [Tritrichomonas foetus]|eukprot:OHT01700.1 hypothetical protein TRFO_31398 [Tritrichomonas foetus]